MRDESIEISLYEDDAFLSRHHKSYQGRWWQEIADFIIETKLLLGSVPYSSSASLALFCFWRHHIIIITATRNTSSDQAPSFLTPMETQSMRTEGIILAPHITSPLHHSSGGTDNYNITQSLTIHKRSYHTTSRNEILPFLAIGGILGITSVYTYRALEQMDNDWEEYYDKVEEYKLKTGIDPEKEYLTVTKQMIDEEKKNQEDIKSSWSFCFGWECSVSSATTIGMVKRE